MVYKVIRGMNMTKVDKYLESLFNRKYGFEETLVWIPELENTHKCRFCDNTGKLVVKGVNGEYESIACPKCGGSGSSDEEFVPQENKLLSIIVSKSANGEKSFMVRTDKSFLPTSSIYISITKEDCQKRCDKLKNENER